ncbi:hypothetical protein RQP46_005430 [Phenoliferia psychrophenolica]
MQAVRPPPRPASPLVAILAKLESLSDELQLVGMTPAATTLDALIQAITLLLQPERPPPTDLAPRLGLAFTQLHTLYDPANAPRLPELALEASAAILRHILEREIGPKVGPDGIGWLDRSSANDGEAWVRCAGDLFNGIQVHAEDCEEAAPENNKRDLPYRTSLAHALFPFLTAMIAPSSDPRATATPPHLKYLALDLLIEIITSHKPNKALLRSTVDFTLFSTILSSSTDRLLSIPTLEIAYRLLPDAGPAPSRKGKERATDAIDERTKKIRTLFAKERFGSGADKLVGMLSPIKTAAFMDTSKKILDEISLGALSRAQPFVALEIVHNGALLSPPPSHHATETQPPRPSQPQMSTDFWVGRDAVAVIVGSGEGGRAVGLTLEEVDEETRYWFVFEQVDKVVLDQRPDADELVATFTLSRPALLSNEPLLIEYKDEAIAATLSHSVVFTLAAAGGENLRVLKKTLVERAKRYPSLHPVSQTNGQRPSYTSAPPPAPPRSSSSSNRKASQAGPVAAIDPGSTPPLPAAANSKEGQLEERREALKSIAEIRSDDGDAGMGGLGDLEDSMTGDGDEGDDEAAPLDDIEDAEDETITPFNLTSAAHHLAPPPPPAPSKSTESISTATEHFVIPDTPLEQPIPDDAPDSSDLSEIDPTPKKSLKDASNPSPRRTSHASPSPNPQPQPQPTRSPARILAPESSLPVPASPPRKSLPKEKAKPKEKPKANPVVDRPPVEPRTTRSRAKQVDKSPAPAVEVTSKLDDAPAVPRKKRAQHPEPSSSSERDEIVLAKVPAGSPPRPKKPTTTQAGPSAKKAKVVWEDVPPYPTRGKITDPSPLDPDAPTATTLVETDKSSGPYTLDQQRLVVAPKRRYGKERKSRKSGPPTPANGKQKRTMEDVEEEPSGDDEASERAAAPAPKLKKAAAAAAPAEKVRLATKSPKAAPKRKKKAVKDPSPVSATHDHDDIPEVAERPRRKGRSGDVLPVAPPPPAVDQPVTLAASPPHKGKVEAPKKKAFTSLQMLFDAPPRRRASPPAPSPPKEHSPSPIIVDEDDADPIDENFDNGGGYDDYGARGFSDEEQPDVPAQQGGVLSQLARVPSSPILGQSGPSTSHNPSQEEVLPAPAPAPAKGSPPTPIKPTRQETELEGADEDSAEDVEMEAPVGERLVAQVEERQLSLPREEVDDAHSDSAQQQQQHHDATGLSPAAKLHQNEESEAAAAPTMLKKPGVLYLGSHELGPAPALPPLEDDLGEADELTKSDGDEAIEFQDDPMDSGPAAAANDLEQQAGSDADDDGPEREEEALSHDEHEAPNPWQGPAAPKRKSPGPGPAAARKSANADGTGEKKAKKRKTKHKPQKNADGVPLWDEDDESMQQAAEALDAIMAQVLRQHQDRREAANASYDQSRQLIDKKASKIRHSLLRNSEEIGAGAKEQFAKLGAGTVKLREIIASRKAAV